MVVETLWPETAPWWLNLFIWMALFWQYILIGFIPAFYVAVVKLFGMPLLQRWSNEVVVMLYPSKVKFGKITQQYEPYFKYKKGAYWMADPLQPVLHEEVPPKYHAKLDEIKEKYELLAEKPARTNKEEKEMKKLLKQQMLIKKKIFTVNPVNQLHVFTHAVNQPIYDMERRDTKVDEILNNDPKLKKISGHGIWIMQNPKAHFHRHYQLIINPNHTLYTIVPVKNRQQFSMGFWHSIGIVLQKEVEIEQKELEVGGSGGEGKHLEQILVTSHVVLQHMKQVQDYQNFSASRAYMLLKRRAKIEEQFIYWITGSINPIIFVVLGGAVAIIAALYLFLGHPPPATPGGPSS